MDTYYDPKDLAKFLEIGKEISRDHVGRKLNYSRTSNGSVPSKLHSARRTCPATDRAVMPGTVPIICTVHWAPSLSRFDEFPFHRFNSFNFFNCFP